MFRCQTVLFATCFGLAVNAPAHAQTVLLPPVPQPSASGDVEGFILQTSAASPGQYVSTGMSFVKGSMPAKSPVKVRDTNNMLTLAQIDEHTHWADGSVKTASITFFAPPFSASASLPFMVTRTGTNSASVPLKLLKNYATIDVTSGTSTYHVDVSQALSGSAADYWLKGPVATEGKVDVPIEKSLHLTIYVRVYANGSAQMDVAFANDLALINGNAETYQATMKLGSSTFTQAISGQQPFTNWHHVIYSGATPAALNIVHDIAVLETTGLVPHYPLTTGVQQSEISQEMAANPCDPLGACGILPYMPTTGGRADIGLIPRWDGIWLQTQDATAAAYAIAQADAAGSVPWHVEQSPSVPVQITSSTNLNWWSDDRCPSNYGPCSPMSYSAAYAGANHGAGSGIVPDSAHMPLLSYLAYLLTGSRYYLDEVAAQAGWSENSLWPVARQLYNGYVDGVVGSDNQLRSAAWSIRDLMVASLAEPNGSSLGSYFTQQLTDNLALTAQIAGNTAKGHLVGWVDGAYDSSNLGRYAPWENDFLALVVEWGVRAQVSKSAIALLKMTPFLVNRFNQQPTTFSPYDSAAYNLILGNSSGYLTTWSSVEQATIAYGTSNSSNPPGSWASDYGVAATSVVVGLPSNSTQQQAATWISNHPAAMQGVYYPANPAWVISP